MSRRVSTVVLPAGALLGVLVLWGVDLLTVFRAHRAVVAAVPEPPNLPWALGVLAVGLILAVACAVGWRRGRGPEYRAYRLPPILLVTALFVELFVFGADRVPLTSAERLQVTMQLLAQTASQASHDGQVPRDPAVLARFAAQLGTPPYLLHGAPAGPFHIQVREGCEGPVQDAPGSALGTLLYCVAKDGRSAWITAVALPAERTYGAPSVYTRDGIVQWAKVEGTPAIEGAPH